MKTKIAALNVLTLLSYAGSAFASSAREDHSGILVWGFLGFCARIVAAQVVPALLMMFGMARGLAPQSAAAKQAAGSR